MVIKSLMKIFGGDSGSSSDSSSPKPPEGLKDLENFVDYVVRALVDHPEEVKVVSNQENEDASVIKIDCNKEDVGKIVGKKGKTIMAIRALVSGAAGRLQKKVAVEVVD
jgi:predicted RNA-binding protein YlqC (UPF0109 family)